jgi:hypothetical protein
MKLTGHSSAVYERQLAGNNSMNKWKILLCCSGMFKNSNLPFIQYIDIYGIEGKLSFTPTNISFVHGKFMECQFDPYCSFMIIDCSVHS